MSAVVAQGGSLHSLASCWQDGYGLEDNLECAKCKGWTGQGIACAAFFLCMTAALVVLSFGHIKKAESEEYGEGSNVRVKIVLLAVAYFQAASLLQGTPFFLDPSPLTANGGSGLDYEWPSVISQSLSVLSFTSGSASSVVSPQCLFAQASIRPVYLMALLSSLVPAVYVLLAITVIVVLKWRSRWVGNTEPQGQERRRILTVVKCAPFHQL